LYLDSLPHRSGRLAGPAFYRQPTRICRHLPVLAADFLGPFF